MSAAEKLFPDGPAGPSTTTDADPTGELLATMASHGLRPSSIQWDGKLRRFQGPEERRGRKSGWYVAHEDAVRDSHGAAFGDWRTGLSETWTSRRSRPISSAQADEWRDYFREQARIRTAEQERLWERAAQRYRAVWAQATAADASHPYLARKGITDPRGLRIASRGRLLIPMSDARTRRLMSLQVIDVGGRKKFAPGGKAAGAYFPLPALPGEPLAPDVVYIAEGYATAWSIQQATGAAVVVAFSAGNLESVADAIRWRLPDARIILAADNDRWSTSGPGGNPGVHFATKAARAVRGELVVPDFVDLEGKPTDFNDLHLQEGLDAVRACLGAATAPAHLHVVAPESAPAPAPAGNDPTPEEPHEPDGPDQDGPDNSGPAPWMDTAPFRALGYDRGTYYYLPRGTGQITGLPAYSHDRKQLVALAPLSWWAHSFPARRGTDWEVAQDALLRACERAGPFRPEKLRGRGCWWEEEDAPTDAGPTPGADAPGRPGRDRALLVHLGDRLLPPGGRRFVDPEGYRSPGAYMYERQPRLKGPADRKALDLAGAQEILGLFRDLLWHEEASGYLAAGWTVLAPVCGALSWRPHIWLTGGAGSGKSTVLRDLIVPLLAGMRRYYEGGSTEAGIRQELRADAIPVVYDEAEASDRHSDARLQSVLALARSASSTEGARTAKGTVHGSALAFQVRSMFCLASIGGAVRQEADKTRVSLLQLRSRESVGAAERREHWRRYAPRLTRVSEDLGRALAARTLRWLRDGRLIETLATFRENAAAVLGDARSGDQYGTLYAGAWTLMAEESPTATEARELIGGEDLSQYIQEQSPDGVKVLRTLLQRRERVDTSSGPRTWAVGEMVDMLRLGSGATDTERDAVKGFLRQAGVRVEPSDLPGGADLLLLANTSQWITSALRDTPYVDGWRNALRTLPGVEGRESVVTFHRGLVSRVTVVPLTALEGS